MEVQSSCAPDSAHLGATSAPEDSAYQSADLRAGILQRIEEHSRLAPLPERWSFLRPSKSTRRLRIDPGELVALLRSEFGVEELLAAQIVERSPDGAVRLSPIFGGPLESFVIRRNTARMPIDAISSRGLLSSPSPDWLRLAAEWTDGLTVYQQPVLLASEDADALVLHRLGVNYTAAAGLEHISGEQARALFTGRAPYRQWRKFNLTIAGWQIADFKFTPCTKVERLVNRILQLKTVLDLEPEATFDIWLPSSGEFRAIRNALSFRDRAAARKALLTSLAKSRFTPANARTVIRDRAVLDYGAARRQLVRDIEASSVFPLCGQTRVDLGRLRTAFKKAVLDKFDAAGATESEPWAKLCSIMGGKIGQDWFGALPEVRAAENIISGAHPENIDSDQLLENRLRLVDAFAKLYALGMRR